jgi:hypothetical protein
LILHGNQLFEIDIVVGVVVVAGLAIALAIPCVHHLLVWWRRLLLVSLLLVVGVVVVVASLVEALVAGEFVDWAAYY